MGIKMFAINVHIQLYKASHALLCKWSIGCIVVVHRHFRGIRFH